MESSAASISGAELDFVHVKLSKEQVMTMMMMMMVVVVVVMMMMMMMMMMMKA